MPPSFAPSQLLCSEPTQPGTLCQAQGSISATLPSTAGSGGGGADTTGDVLSHAPRGQRVGQAPAGVPTSMGLALPSGFVLVGQAPPATSRTQQLLLAWPPGSFWTGLLDHSLPACGEEWGAASAARARNVLTLFT